MSDQLRFRPDMARLRRIAWTIAGVLAIALIGEIGARVALAESSDAIRWYDASAQLKVDQMDDRTDIDVVFAGTSMAWQAFVPAVVEDTTGRSGYNAGLNGGTPEVMERWLVEEVVPRLDPTLVVWGLSSYDFAPAYGDQQRAIYDDALATREGWLASLDQTVSAHSELVSNRTVLRSLNDIVGNGADLRRSEHDEARETTGEDGERLDYDENLSADLLAITRARLSGFHIDGSDVDRIVATARDLQANGIEVVFVELPVPDRFIAAHPNGDDDHRMVGEAINLVSSLLGSRFIDLSEGLSDDEFVDYTHLTQDAAARFSAAFSDAFAAGRDDRSVVTTLEPGPSDEQQPGCSLRTVIDEYGFEVEILDCSDAPVEPPVEATPISDPGLEDALAALDLACAGEGELAAALVAVSAAIDTTTARAAAEGLSEADVRATYDSIEPAALGPAPCLLPEVDDELLAATAGVVGALDRLRGLESSFSKAASGVWTHRDSLLIALWSRNVVDEGREVDAVVIGNSVPKTGIDPVLLGERLGMTVANASMAGGTVERLDPFVTDMLQLVDPTVVYWPISYFDVFGNCRVTARLDAQDELITTLDAAFGGINDRPDAVAWAHLLGPVGSDAYGTSPVRETILDEEITSLGRAVIASRPNDEQLQSQIDNERRDWQTDEPCVDRFPLMADAVEAMQADGRFVVMFPILPNERFAETHPGGVDAFLRAADDIAAEAEPDQYIRDVVPLAPELYEDGVHLIRDGREQLTRGIAERLLDE